MSVITNTEATTILNTIVDSESAINAWKTNSNNKNLLVTKWNLVVGLARHCANDTFNAGNKRAGDLLNTLDLEITQLLQDTALTPNFAQTENARFKNLALQLRDAVYNFQQLTPQKSQANAAPISNRQNGLVNEINKINIGGKWSVTGALLGTNLEKFTAEWSAIQKLITSTDLLSEDRDRLSIKQKEIMHVLENKTVAAANEGVATVEVIEKVNDVITNAKATDGKLACFVLANSFSEKMKCLFGNQWKIFVAVIGVGGVIALLLALSPYVRVIGQLTGRKKRRLRRN